MAIQLLPKEELALLELFKDFEIDQKDDLYGLKRALIRKYEDKNFDKK